jgi:hypothetical protein
MYFHLMSNHPLYFALIQTSFSVNIPTIAEGRVSGPNETTAKNVWVSSNIFFSETDASLHANKMYQKTFNCLILKSLWVFAYWPNFCILTNTLC